MKIKNHLSTFGFVGFIFIQSSCSVYTSQNPPPVLIESKKEIEISGGASISPVLWNPGLNASFSYGISNKIQAQLYGSLIFPILNNGKNGTSHIQGCIGYSVFSNNSYSFKTFAGYFHGTSNIEFPNLQGLENNFKGNYNSIFGQSQLTVKKDAYYYGCILKVGDFNSIEKVNLSNTDIKDKGLLIEPSIFYSRHFNGNLKLNLSYSYSFLNIKRYSNNYNNNFHFNNPYGNLGIAIIYTISKKRNQQ
ncbi:MAG: hypothetical protein ACPGSO_04010 [Vicingaceae bacterium]